MCARYEAWLQEGKLPFTQRIAHVIPSRPFDSLRSLRKRYAGEDLTIDEIGTQASQRLSIILMRDPSRRSG
jgi:hypothetical protein